MNNEIKNKEKNNNIPYETFEIDTSKVNKNNKFNFYIKANKSKIRNSIPIVQYKQELLVFSK